MIDMTEVLPELFKHPIAIICAFIGAFFIDIFVVKPVVNCLCKIIEKFCSQFMIYIFKIILVASATIGSAYIIFTLILSIS